MYKCPNNKQHQQDFETMVRRYYGLLGMHDNGKVFLRIEFFGGFEYFNTRPYHNYETWGHGWRISVLFDHSCKARDIVVENECLLCCMGDVMNTLAKCRVLNLTERQK